MSALARFFKSIGCNVSGYDRTETPLTKQLVAEGIEVCYTDTVDCIDMKATLVVYTPAIPNQHEGFTFYRNNEYNLHKRSEVLGWLTSSMFNVCVAGTHGKTTTSTMVAHILRDSGVGCNAFLGGISANYKTNFWSSKTDIAVAEADEYDRSFLHLNPNVAVITSMDPDHLDIYGTEENLQSSFLAFSQKVIAGGTLIVKKGIQREKDLKAHELITYGVENPDADMYAKNIRVENGKYIFDITGKLFDLNDVVLNMGGEHNIENATAAAIAAFKAGVKLEDIKKAINCFKGVKRRFEFVLKQKNKVLIDDYAHHPQELSALIQGVKHLYPNKKMLVVFQPHLYSRTRDFASGFAKSLSNADEVILLPIYPARELPMPGVESEMIAKNITVPNSVVSKQELMHIIAEKEIDVLVMAGAGDIDALVEPVKNILSNK